MSRLSLLTVVVVAALLLAPLCVGAGTVGALINVLIAALFALAFNLLVGQSGMMSFGHAAYFAFGAFATLHAMIAAEHGEFSVPTPLLPLVGGAGGLVVGFIGGYFATIRSGVYFAMITLAIAELFHLLAPNLNYAFGGEAGVSTFRAPFGPLSFASDLQVYYLTFAWVIGCAGLLWLYARTPFGHVTLALRDNEQRLEFMGFDTHRAKTLVFAISAMFSGVAGGLFAVANESGNYILFGMDYSSSVVFHTIIGGSGVFLGPAFGAALLSLGGYYASDATRYWLLYQGVAFVLVVMYLPSGLGGGFVHLLTTPWTIARKRAALAMLPAAGVAGAAIFLIEALGHLFSRDYVARLAADGGVAPPIRIMGGMWNPMSASTWAPPLLTLAFCLYAVAATMRWSRAGLDP